MIKALVLTVAAASAASGLVAVPAQAAGAARIWVSGKGVDQAGCGAPTAPCRSLQYAHDNVAEGGEIDILDPAGYGAVAITKAVSIVNDGVGTAGVQAASGDAISISAGANDTVYLRGLNIDGENGAGGYGVVFSAGAGLTMINCVVRHFSHDGVLLAPTAGAAQVLIADTIASDNAGIGVEFDPISGDANVTGTIERVIANNDLDGIYIGSDLNTGTISFTLHNVVTNQNTTFGIAVTSIEDTKWVAIDSAVSNANGSDGLIASGAASVHISRSLFDKNGYVGIQNSTVTGGGVYSSGDNHADDDESGPVSSPLLTDALH